MVCLRRSSQILKKILRTQQRLVERYIDLQTKLSQTRITYQAQAGGSIEKLVPKEKLKRLKRRKKRLEGRIVRFKEKHLEVLYEELHRFFNVQTYESGDEEASVVSSYLTKARKILFILSTKISHD
ncbi:hypothetical protein Avbf_18968 [Armadillidium vulgare]|nr:hypothetical protein Avbf_18968 [Armadillidium vulgare]